MKTIDLEAFDRAELQHDPCDFIVVPRFIRPEALESLNRDYPAIETAGNFPIGDHPYGPAFETLLQELASDELRAHYEAKFGLDLSPYPLQTTVRRFSDQNDGNIHNDSTGKILTTLIYFNEHWTDPAGRLRLLRSSEGLDDYGGEVVPEQGNLVAFRRSERSYHGFHKVDAERRSLQMYWVKPKRAKRGEKAVSTLGRRLKRLLEGRIG